MAVQPRVGRRISNSLRRNLEGRTGNIGVMAHSKVANIEALSSSVTFTTVQPERDRVGSSTGRVVGSGRAHKWRRRGRLHDGDPEAPHHGALGRCNAIDTGVRIAHS